MRHICFIVAFGVAASAPLASSLHATAKIEEVIAGPTNAGGLYVVSQNHARVAYVGAKGTRTVVTVDGVEGPVLDELFNGSAGFVGSGNLLVHPANAGGKFNGTPTAVVFSENGSHFAYIGRQGNDYLVVHDGKEVGRGPRSALSLSHSPLGLSPTGKWAFWGEMKTEAGRGTYRLIMNGKPEPWSGHQDLKPVFSPDDSRYAYIAANPADHTKPILIVDGKAGAYVGGLPVFTSDNKLVTTSEAKNVFVEGKRLPTEGISVERITPGPTGGRLAVIMRKKLVNHQGVGALYLDGKEVPGTEGAADITFSPDGKRWALRCINPEARSSFMVVDGKKGAEYQAIAERVFWTPDSAHVIYQITSSGRNFVVVDTQEFPVQSVAALMRAPFTFAKRGSRYAFSSVDGSNRNFLTIVDGKNVLPAGLYPDGTSFDFSDDGQRYAFAVGQIGRQGMTALVDNGTLNDQLTPTSFNKFGAVELVNAHFLLSPDGKYLARMARTPQNTRAGLYINDRLVFPTTMQVAYPTFTSDSKHLFWLAAERATGRPGTDYVVYVDGEPVTKFAGEQLLGTKGSWQLGADGTLTCLGVSGDSVKRFKITPSSETNIESMFARAEAAETKAVADAAAAKQKAEADATAAKEKATADAAAKKQKAADDAAAATLARKEAYDAKVKARQDAVDARKKAAAEAAAARQKK